MTTLSKNDLNGDTQQNMYNSFMLSVTALLQNVNDTSVVSLV